MIDLTSNTPTYPHTHNPELVEYYNIYLNDLFSSIKSDN